MSKTIMGAIIGDIAGSRFEFNPTKRKDFELFVENKYFNREGKFTLGYYHDGCRFTDDTVMTLAICKSLFECKGDKETLHRITIKNMQELGRKYPYSGYGYNFNEWIFSDNPQPYNSFGNGSAMRIGAVPYFADNLDEVKELSKIVAEVSHNHPEGIKGAEATAVAIWLALHGSSKEEIKTYIEENYYKLDYDYEDLLVNYGFDETCQGSVPQSIFAFLISDSYEDTIRTAVSLGADADTMAAIAGGIAGAYYGVPENIEKKAKEFLTDDLLEIVNSFEKKMNN